MTPYHDQTDISAEHAGAIAAHSNGAGEFLTPGKYEKFTVTHLGVSFRTSISEEDWLEATRKSIAMFEGARDLHVRAMFVVGDCLNFGELQFGEKYSQAIDSTRKAMRMSVKTVQNAAWIAGSIPDKNRHEMLSFAHHEVVAPLTDEKEQGEFLQRAEDDEMSVAELKKTVKAEAKSFPPPRTSSKPKKPKVEGIDFTTQPGVVKALGFCSEYFSVQVLKDMSEDEKKEMSGAIVAVVEQFGRCLHPKFFEQLCKNVALFMEQNEEAEPIREWTDAKKKAWQPWVNEIAKAGRRAAIIGGAAPHRRGEQKEEG